MGQYHTIYNKTKKEYFSIGGAKLFEKASNLACSMGLMVLLCNSNGRGGGDLNVDREYDKTTYKPLPLTGRKKEVGEALAEIQGRWAGDSIVIQGDYAKKGDPAFIGPKIVEGFTNITELLELALEADTETAEIVKREQSFRARFK